MATPEDVQKLASLARIEVSEESLPALVKEFEGILAYVGRLSELTIPEEGDRVLPEVRNVLREDGEPCAPGTFTDALVAQFPERDGNYLSVKQIIVHD